MAGKDGPAQAGPGAANGNLGHNAAPDWYRDARANVWLPYTQMQNAPALPVVTHADGVHLTLADGRRLVDGIASWWTACHGYNHPHIVAAVESQNRAMQHVMFAGLAHEPAYRLASRLAALLPGDLNHVFFSESGSVSVEVALKIALQYWRNKGFTGPHSVPLLSRRLSRRHHGDDGGHRSRESVPCGLSRRAARAGRREMSRQALPTSLRSTACSRTIARNWLPSSWNRWCRRRAA